MNKKLIVLIMIMSLLVADQVVTWVWFRHVQTSVLLGFSGQVDAAVVFMGDFDLKTKQLGPQSLRSLHQALGLYAEKRVKHILCAGGYRPRLGIFQVEEMKKYLLARGVPREQIVLDRFSFDTPTNWRNSRQIIMDKGWQSVALISCPLHIYRIKGIVAKDPLPEVRIAYAPFSYDSCHPGASWLEIWQRVHYEWTAAFAQKLPPGLYQPIIRVLRSQDGQNSSPVAGSPQD